MPHPTVATDTPDDGLPSNTTTTHPLVSQAYASAICLFESHVQAVLQQSSSEGLRKLIRTRIRSHFLAGNTNNPASIDNTTEQSCISTNIETDDDVSNLFKKFPHLLQVTSKDIGDCYAFASRVGIKWAAELKRQGCVEFSEIVMRIAEEGHYLEPSKRRTVQKNRKNDDVDGSNEDNLKADKGKYKTPYASLHSLRRYKSDCDGSGKPLTHLRSMKQDESVSSARKITQQIDEMARDGQTYWHHGWDAVEEAVKRNRERIGYSRASQEEETDVYVKRRNIKKRVHFECEAEAEEYVEAASESTKRRKQDLDDDEHLSPGKFAVDRSDEIMCGGGRSASSIGDTAYDWNNVLQSMTSQERKDLIKSSFHPPYPFEESDINQATANSEEDCSVNVVGALKQMGLTHLFEQTRHLPKDEKVDDIEEATENKSQSESFLGAYEARVSFRSQQLDRMKNKALRRAEKERLGRRTAVAGEKNSDYTGLGTTASKVKLTEEVLSLSAKVKREPPIGNKLSLQIFDEPELQRWIELDLGECFIEETEQESSSPETGTGTRKKFMAFRSLEIAIMG